MHQKVELIGYLGSDPDSRFTPAGKQVTNFSLATSKTWNDSNGQKQSVTTWFRVSCWGRLAEVTQEYIKKGSRIYVEGTLQPDPETGSPKIWTRQDGTPGASYEIRAGKVLFLDSKEESNQQSQREEVPF